MPLYEYKARTQTGELVIERIEARTKPEAIVELQNQRLILSDIREVKKDFIIFERKGASTKDLSLFCKQLGQLVETGITVHHGIELIAEHHKNKKFQAVLNNMVKDIKAGVSVTKAMESHKNVFPEIMVYQLKAAEDGGFLSETLKNLSLDFQRERNFKKTIRGAFSYPGFIVLVTIGMMWFMMTKIVPTLTTTLSDFDAELPAITKMVIGVSEFVQSYWYMVAISVGVTVVVTVYLYRQDNYRLKIDQALMKTPLVGNLITVINLARISRVMSSLMGSGVGIDQTLENANKIINNFALSKAMEQVKDEVLNKGATLNKALEKHEYFPKTFVQIVNIGEESGNLADVLAQLAEQYEEEVKDALKAVTSVINPVLMIGIGVVVGIVVVAMFVPMFSLMESL